LLLDGYDVNIYIIKSGSCYSIFSFMCKFCRPLFVILSFFFPFDHCVFCFSSIYGFLLPFWYLQILPMNNHMLLFMPTFRLKTGGKLMCSGRVSRSCFTSGIHVLRHQFSTKQVNKTLTLQSWFLYKYLPVA
jgi:hypothetical protein